MKNLETSKTTQQGETPAIIIKVRDLWSYFISVSFNNAAKKA